MNHEQSPIPGQRKPYEVFGLTEQEQLFWRVSQERFAEILKDDHTLIHKVEENSNDFGEFLFVTTSRAARQERIGMTFYGLGYHEQRERWITDEWFWYQTNLFPDLFRQRLTQEEAEELLKQRREKIGPQVRPDTQTNFGRMFEILADLTDEDGALAEMEDIGDWLDFEPDIEPNVEPPTGENLLDTASREKLPELYSGEEQGLEALAQVKFFTPDSNWTWYASEFDGEDIFFGLVSGFDVELGNFSLRELQEARGPLGLPIERDLHFEPRTLRELKEQHELDMHP